MRNFIVHETRFSTLERSEINMLVCVHIIYIEYPPVDGQIPSSTKHWKRAYTEPKLDNSQMRARFR